MSPAPREPRRAIARIALRSVPATLAVERPPVFHVFEDLYQRSLRDLRRDAALRVRAQGV